MEEKKNTWEKSLARNSDTQLNKYILSYLCRERNAAYKILSSPRSSNQSRSGSRIILERGRNLLLSLVIPGKPMNPRLD